MKYWAVIPAAGIGSRMQSDTPKQYLKIFDKTILEHTLDRFINHPQITGVAVAVSSEDEYWQALDIKSDKPMIITTGGMERCHSVLSALQSLDEYAEPQDWVLVHDAARPCLRSLDIDKLINEVSEHPVGGLLALPVKDTMKRSDGNAITETVERNNLWHALTPQMFRLTDLRSALEKILEKDLIVTDEAQAMEMMQQMPLLVEGHMDNIKITHPQDLELATHYLKAQGYVK